MARLGEGFDVVRFTIGRGSVEILVAIAAAFEIVANWNDVVRNVGRLITRLRAYFSRGGSVRFPGRCLWRLTGHPTLTLAWFCLAKAEPPLRFPCSCSGT